MPDASVNIYEKTTLASTKELAVSKKPVLAPFRTTVG